MYTEDYSSEISSLFNSHSLNYTVLAASLLLRVSACVPCVERRSLTLAAADVVGSRLLRLLQLQLLPSMGPVVAEHGTSGRC